MRPIILSFILGSFLTAVPAMAFHYFGHDQGAEDLNRMQQWQERQNQQWERLQQEMFRNQQRANPC